METLLLPKLGQTMEEAEIVEWYVAEGDTFDVGDDLYEVETEKSNATVEATIGGRLHSMLHTAGSIVPVGAVVGVVLEPDEEPDPEELAVLLGTATSGHRSSPEPAAETVAEEERPVEADEPAGGRRATLEGVRKQTARVVTESWQEIPHFQQVVLADATELLAARAKLRDEPTDSRLCISLNDIILDRIVRAVQEVPVVNASYQDGTVVQYDDVNAAVAVATDRGLVTPVLRRSNRMSLFERGRALQELVRRSVNAELSLADVENPTITVSNLGMYEIDTGFALITRPQTAVVFVGQVHERPMVVDGSVVARQSVYVSVSYDHRVLDGVAAARFLSALRHSIESTAA